MWRRARSRLLAGSTAIVLAAPLHAVMCTIDRVPAATLLVPAVIAETNFCESAGPVDTVIRWRNTEASATLTRVTLWTDWSVPALGFDVYLPGFGEQALSLRRLFCDGYLPSTGVAVSSAGPASDANTNFTGCNGSSLPGASPVYGGDGALSAAQLAHVTAWMTGAASPTTGDCAGENWGDGQARGYVTIDVIRRCDDLSPADGEDYFVDVIAFDNVLTGEYELVDPANNFAQGERAVPIEAISNGGQGGAVLADGEVTFYGRYDSQLARNGREPLPTTFAAAFQDANDEGSQLLIWREGSAAATPRVCGDFPTWWPLDQSSSNGGSPIILFDEDGNPYPRPDGLSVPGVFLPLESQLVDVSDSPGPFSGGQVPSRGWLILNLQNSQTVYESPAGQAWVLQLPNSDGLYSELADAVALDSSCDGLIVQGVGGPLATNPENPVIFADGFDSGDVSLWSLAVSP